MRTDPVTPRHRPRNALDAGWLFLIPGLALLAAALLIPAQDDLESVRAQRDHALDVEQSVLERLGRHESFLSALDRRDPVLMSALAETQLNLIAPGREALAVGRTNPSPTYALASLETTPPRHQPRRRTDSFLERWATGNTPRLWLIAVGAGLVMIGLLPPADRRRSDHPRAPAEAPYPAGS